MQLRCTKCHKPYNITREAAATALDEMTKEGHKFEMIQCPMCRKTNKVSKKELKRAAPGWKPKEA